MKSRTKIILALAILLGVAALTSMRRGANPGRGANGGACCPLTSALNAKMAIAGTNQISTNAAAQQTIAYYFHATVRCETCLLIEAQARVVIEQQFKAELAGKRLLFKSMNYELPENAHFLADYKLPCPSLVLVRRENGLEKKWKLLGETWELVHHPAKLHSYVESEVRTFLSGNQQQTGTNQVEPPPAPDHR